MAEPIEETIMAWMPEQDRIRLAILGKLIEECSELAARAARCIIQGLDEPDPKSGLSNLIELQRESADVTACVDLAADKLGFNTYGERYQSKLRGFNRWHILIAELQAK